MAISKSKHLEHVKYEIRGRIAERAAELKAGGANVIELNIGNPGAFGFQVPDAMNLALIRNLDKAAPYCNSKGIVPAREAIVADAASYGLKNLDIEHVYIGNGCSELIVMSMEALLNPGDEVLVPSPDYPLWTAAVRLADGKAMHYPCVPEKGWQPDVEAMAAMITDKTRGIVVINPNNPTGAVYPQETLLAILELARKHNLIIFADEIYSKITYNGVKHVPLATLSTDILTITYNGISKNYRACGFRSGWMYFTGPVAEAKDYMEGITLLASMRLCANVTAQWTIPTALSGYQSIFSLTTDGGRLKEQRDLTVKRLNAIPGIKCAAPEGSLYAFPEIDLQMYKFKDAEDFCFRFLEEKHVMVVHGTGFNYSKSAAFRVVFLPWTETLANAFDRLEEFLLANKR